MNQTALEVVSPEPITPMRLLEIATSQNADIDKLQKLMELQMIWESNQARKAFNVAFSDFKSEAVTIVKNVTVKDGPLKNQKYADLFGVVNIVSPVMSKHGLSHSWKLTKDDPTWMEVTCTIKHILGHSESVSMGASPDTGPGRNAIQSRGSAKSYLERYTLLAAVGMAAANDDDGAGTGPRVESGAVADQIALIEKCDDPVELQRVFTLAYKWADDAGDKNASGQIIRARDKRKQELKTTPPAEFSGNRVAEPLVVERLEWIKDAKDMDELKRIYNNAIKMAKQAGDESFVDQLTKAANKRAEAIRASN